MAHELEVWLFADRVGTLALVDGRLNFRYASGWLSQQDAVAWHSHSRMEGPGALVFAILATVESRRAGQQGLRRGGAGAGWICLVHCAAGNDPGTATL